MFVHAAGHPHHRNPRHAQARSGAIIASQEALRRWISPNLDIDLKVGGKYRFLGPDDKTWVSGRVMELVPEGWLILSWLEEDQGWTHPAPAS